ncbi:PaaI family thioesterase [Halorubellus sp. JP-L1]|uniref:PaaI family thioesterase n=1 Tax=Halorubellus sp. JP-L1 TaxID=2715753 RepID=UPI00140B7514|nr:PaaI family thioesterase [Halorubellus sp. JP-L1]NHN43122.1 PaaI family thioesterase [Halorubellus sp. JP-L1]
MDVLERFNEKYPFGQHLGLEITAAEDGVAKGHVALEDHHSLSETTTLAHGAVPFALADSLSAAALASVEGNPGPTLDVRIDYLRPATGDIHGEAVVDRYGSDTGVVETELFDAEENSIAKTRGVYKTNLVGGQNPFVDSD